MLTDTAIKKAEPRVKDYKLADKKDLFLLVRASGSKLWRHKYRTGNKERLSSCGPYPEVSLRQAREQRDASGEILRAGRNSAIKGRKAAASALPSTSHSRLRYPISSAPHAGEPPAKTCSLSCL